MLLWLTMALAPRAVVLVRPGEPEPGPARYPTAVLRPPVTLFSSASRPLAVLSLPVVLENSAL